MKHVSECGCSRDTYRRAQVIYTQEGGSRDGGDSFLSAQVTLAFPGVTDTQINPQDADSAVTMDWQQGIEAASPQIPVTDQTSNPLLSAGSSTSCLTGQTMRETDKRDRER